MFKVLRTSKFSLSVRANFMLKNSPRGLKIKFFCHLKFCQKYQNDIQNCYKLNMPYQQCQPPSLSLIFQLSQSEEFGMVETWPNTIATFYVHSQKKLLVLYKGQNNSICLLVFEQFCLCLKKTFKIFKAKNRDISALNLNMGKNSKTDEQIVYILLGFEDGSVQIFCVLANEKNMSLVKVSQFSFDHQTKPITKLQFSDGNLYICFLYGLVVVEENIFEIKKKNKEFKVKSKSLAEKYKHCFHLGEKNKIFLYNEINGCIKFSYGELDHQLKVQDCIKTMIEVPHQDGKVLILGSNDNSVKIVNYTEKIIQKFSGFKNFIPAVDFDEENSIVWVGCLDGTISCFFLKPEHNIREENTFKVQEFKIKKPQNFLIQNGILNLFVHGKMLIVKDIQQNIYFYDIIDESFTTERASSQ